MEVMAQNGKAIGEVADRAPKALRPLFYDLLYTLFEVLHGRADMRDWHVEIPDEMTYTTRTRVYGPQPAIILWPLNCKDSWVALMFGPVDRSRTVTLITQGVGEQFSLLRDVFDHPYAGPGRMHRAWRTAADVLKEAAGLRGAKSRDKDEEATKPTVDAAN